MSTALSRKLLVITGKGGAGKTTVSAATGLLAASRGLRTIVVEVGERQQLPALFGLRGWDAGVEHQLDERLWSLSIDPDRALLEWLQLLIDPARSGYVAVAQPAEMAVTETIELQRRLRGLLGRELDAIVVNGVLPRRFSEQDLRALADGDEPVQRAAARAARAVHARA